MTHAEVLSAVTTVAQDIFQEDDLVLSDQTTAKDVEAWDSLAHIQFILAVERKFGVRFDAGEVTGIQNVGALVALVLKKLQR